MNAYLSAVAVGSPRSSLSANILEMSRTFARGVPADDAMCARMIRALRDCEDWLDICISAEFSARLLFLPEGVGFDRGYNGIGEGEEALLAWFYLGDFWDHADGLRQFVRDVRSAACALRDQGLCPRCPSSPGAVLARASAPRVDSILLGDERYDFCF